MGTVRMSLHPIPALVMALAGLLSVLVEPTAGAASTVAVEPCPTVGPQVELTSVEQVEDLLEGVWVRCDGPESDRQGEIGLEVVGDAFHRLYQDTDGALIRASGAEQEGTLTVIDMTAWNGPGSYQVTFAYQAWGYTMAEAEFSTDPDTLRLGTTTYRLWEGAPPADGVPPGTGTGPCDAPGDVVIPGSATAVTELLTGTWVSCSDALPVGLAEEGQVGWQFGDGHFNRVFQDADGGLIRADGADREGTVTVLEIPVGLDSYQVDLRILGGGLAPVQATFFDDGRILRFGDADLYRWDGPDPVPGDPPGLGGQPCDVLRDIVVPVTVEEVEARLAGAWVLCRGSWNLGGGANGQIGFEVVDGTVHQLFDDGQGGVVRGGAPEHLGTAVVVSVTPAEQISQINLEWPAGTGIGLATFFDDPDTFRYTSFGGVADYLRWTGPTTPEPPDPEPPPTCHRPHHRHGHPWARWHHHPQRHGPWNPPRNPWWNDRQHHRWPTLAVAPPWWHERR